MSGTGYLIPDIIKDLLSKMINATGHNERNYYELQVRAIRDACNTALAKASTTPVKSRQRKHAKRNPTPNMVIDYRQFD